MEISVEKDDGELGIVHSDGKRFPRIEVKRGGAVIVQDTSADTPWQSTLDDVVRSGLVVDSDLAAIRKSVSKRCAADAPNDGPFR